MLLNTAAAFGLILISMTGVCVFFKIPRPLLLTSSEISHPCTFTICMYALRNLIYLIIYVCVGKCMVLMIDGCQNKQIFYAILNTERLLLPFEITFNDCITCLL